MTWRTFFIMSLLGTLSSVEAQYTVTVHHPSGAMGSQAFDAFEEQVVGSVRNPGSSQHAWLWNGASGTVDLNPASGRESEAYAVDGEFQFGWTRGVGGTSGRRAARWNGTPDSHIDLHPPNSDSSEVHDAAFGRQVGFRVRFGEHTAASWSGTASSYVNLHPPGYIDSEAKATSLTTVVGFVTNSLNANSAGLWRDSAASFVNLNPVGATSSSASGTYGEFQVGSAQYTTNGSRAFLWSGTAESAIDLHPAGFTTSYATDCNERYQVGGGLLGTRNYALRWEGSSASVLNLHDFLPSGYIRSFVNGMDPISGRIAGQASLSDGTSHAITWDPVPEPSTVLVLLPLVTWLACPRAARYLTRSRPRPM